MGNAPWEVSVFLEVPVLITPLGCDSNGVFDKSDNDEETANCREMGLQGLRVNVDHVFDFGSICSNLLKRIVWVRRGGRLVGWCTGSKAMRIISIRWTI